jgi:hypothetical protein
MSHLGENPLGETSLGEPVFRGMVIRENVVRGNVIRGIIFRGNVIMGIGTVPKLCSEEAFLCLIRVHFFMRRTFRNFLWRRAEVEGQVSDNIQSVVEKLDQPEDNHK